MTTLPDQTIKEQLEDTLKKYHLEMSTFSSEDPDNEEKWEHYCQRRKSFIHQTPLYLQWWKRGGGTVV